MPARNAAAYVGSSVRSLLKQTHRDWELVLVDDGSVDGTADIVRAVGGAHVTILRHEVSLGVARSLNDGIERSTGDVIVRLDADDLAHPERVERQVERLRARPELDAVATAFRYIGADGRRLPSPPRSGDWGAEIVRHLLLVTNPICHPTVAFRRSSLPDRPYPEGFLFEDRALWLDQRMAWNWEILGDRLTCWRLHGGNQSFKVSQQGLTELIPLQIAALAQNDMEISADAALALLKPGMTGCVALQTAAEALTVIEQQAYRIDGDDRAGPLFAQWRLRAAIAAMKASHFDAPLVRAIVPDSRQFAKIAAAGAGGVARRLHNRPRSFGLGRTGRGEPA